MFKVFQVELTDAKADEVNAAGGWNKVAWGKTYLDLTMSMFDTEQEMMALIEDAAKHGLIKHTMNIECDELEEAFALGNGMGDMSKVTEHCRHKSMSVGDIAIRNDSRGGGVVKNFGFELLSEKQVREFECLVPQRMGLVQ